MWTIWLSQRHLNFFKISHPTGKCLLLLLISIVVKGKFFLTNVFVLYSLNVLRECKLGTLARNRLTKTDLWRCKAIRLKCVITVVGLPSAIPDSHRRKNEWRRAGYELLTFGDRVIKANFPSPLPTFRLIYKRLKTINGGTLSTNMKIIR